MTKYEAILAALKNEAKAVVGLNTYKGSADIAKFVAKYADEAGDKGLLAYAQTRIFEKNTKYVTRARFGC